MPMRFSHAHEVLPRSWGSARAIGMRSEVRHAFIRFRYRDLNSVPGSQMRNAKSRAPDHHERQPKIEF